MRRGGGGGGDGGIIAEAGEAAAAAGQWGPETGGEANFSPAKLQIAAREVIVGVRQEEIVNYVGAPHC